MAWNFAYDKVVLPSCEKWLFDRSFKGITTDWYHMGDAIVSAYKSADASIKKSILSAISCPLYKPNEFKDYLRTCVNASKWIEANIKPIADSIYYKKNSDIAKITQQSDELKAAILTNDSNPLHQLHHYDPSDTVFDALFDSKESSVVRPSNGSLVKLGWTESDIEKLLVAANASFGKDRFSNTPRGEMAQVMDKMVCWYTSDLIHDNSGRVPRSLKVVGSLASNSSLYRATRTISNAAGKIAVMLGKVTKQDFGEERK